MSNYEFLQTRMSILEAKIQQETSRPRADQVRLGLLARMKSTLIAEIDVIERGDDLAGTKEDFLVAQRRKHVSVVANTDCPIQSEQAGYQST